MNLYDEFLNDWSKKWFQYIKDNFNKPWNYEYLSSNKMDKARKEYIRKRFQEWFKKSDLKKELMENVWHPRNFWKFKYLDPETFEDIEE